MLANEDSPRLQALDGRVLRSLLDMLRQPPSTDALLAALAAITSLAEAWPSHRWAVEHDDSQLAGASSLGREDMAL